MRELFTCLLCSGFFTPQLNPYSDESLWSLNNDSKAYLDRLTWVVRVGGGGLELVFEDTSWIGTANVYLQVKNKDILFKYTARFI